jgi:hypothetical protein
MFTFMAHRSIYSWQKGGMRQNEKKSKTATVIIQST